MSLYHGTIEEVAHKVCRTAPSGYTFTALYPYHRADGSLEWASVRADNAHGDKWTRPIRHERNGYAKQGPAKRVGGKLLYRLPALVAADPAAPVFVVEGEKCADALASLGLVATTSGSATSAN